MSDQESAAGYYSIGYISRACGIPSDTIRTWERRYGYPVPIRLESGHRRYSGETIERLCLVKEALGAGIRPARALRSPLPVLRELMMGPDPEASGKQDPSQEPSGARFSAEIRSCLLAAEQLREDRIAAVLDQAWAAGPPPDFIDFFVMPLLRAIGKAWVDGELGVAHEHCASSLVESYLSDRWRHITASVGTGNTMVCTTLPDDRHSIAVHAASLVLRTEGIPTVVLGCDTPIEETLTALRQTEARALVLSVSRVVSDTAQLRGLNTLRRALPDDVALCYGGRESTKPIPGTTFLPTFKALSCWAAQYALPK